MKLIANTFNGCYLRDILPNGGIEIDGVLAAIAYGNNGNDEKNDFIGNCLKNHFRLDIWMRYDHTVPVGVSMLKRLLKHQKDNIFCRLVPDYLHAKVIWWKGYGAYIGSANLTDRAWVTNIEAGLFLSESDLHENQMIDQLEEFFDELRALKVARPLTREIVEEMVAISEARKEVLELGKKLRKQIPIWEGPAMKVSKENRDEKKEEFSREWNEAITILRMIGEEITNFKPKWINSDVPQAWQADQFLHAYYYTQINDGQSIPYESEFARNQANPRAALDIAMTWWSKTEKPPTTEDVMLHEHAPLLRRLLAKDSIGKLSESELAQVFEYTHATKDHVAKMDLATLGRPDLNTLNLRERVVLYAEWISSRTNLLNWDVKRLLEYVLYEGPESELWERMYTAAKNPDYKFSHYGLNSIAELVGWVRPEVSPPRNGRTSKALRSLGYPVKILH